MALDENKIPANFIIDEKIASNIRAKLSEGKLPCEQAIALAQALKIPPPELRKNADALKIHLSNCQLGLFGYPDKKKGWLSNNIPQKPVPEGLEDALRATADAQKHLTCPQAWAVAAQFKVSRMQVGYLADRLGLRISACQLGVF